MQRIRISNEYKQKSSRYSKNTNKKAFLFSKKQINNFGSIQISGLHSSHLMEQTI
jgi:hypothetical protein